MDKRNVSSFGKMYPAYSTLKTMLLDASSLGLLGKKSHYSRQGRDGQTQVLCLDHKDQPAGGYLMPNISDWPNDAAVCSLSQVLDKGLIPQKYFLSAKACAGILRRAEKRGKTLPGLLKAALERVVSLEQTEPAADMSSQCVSGGGNTRGAIDPAATLTARGQRIDFEVETFAVQSATGDISHALNTANNGKGCSEDGTGRGVPTIVVHGTQDPCVSDKAFALGRNSGRENAVLAFTRKDLGVRRLTPMECERLQGFSDGYTDVQYRGKPAADGPRYKAIGNSMAVPCMRFIGSRIQLKSENTLNA